jgi:peptidyl-prolyl cis-trans isomerase A (cyclophilin A)
MPHRAARFALPAVLCLASGVVAVGSGCSSSSDDGAAGGAVVDDTGPDPLACTRDPGAPAATVDPLATTDPTGGPARFGMDDAMAGFPSTAGTLKALFQTEKGQILCTLDEAAAPITVANFVGLARGTRPYHVGGAWRLGHFYDGLEWHRVIPGFVIQGGDPLGDGTGGPGYTLPVENHVDEPAGTLAMAAGAAPNGSQLYIVVGEGPAADYNVFGRCTTGSATAIAGVRTDANDRPVSPVHILRVDVARCP